MDTLTTEEHQAEYDCLRAIYDEDLFSVNEGEEWFCVRLRMESQSTDTQDRDDDNKDNDDNDENVLFLFQFSETYPDSLPPPFKISSTNLKKRHQDVLRTHMNSMFQPGEPVIHSLIEWSDCLFLLFLLFLPSHTSTSTITTGSGQKGSSY